MFGNSGTYSKGRVLSNLINEIENTKFSTILQKNAQKNQCKATIHY